MKLKLWRFCLMMNLAALLRAIYCRAVDSHDEAFLYMSIACIFLAVAIADLRLQVKR